jgi:hypothetical protein
VAAAKILAFKVDKFIDLACLPCQPACLVLCLLQALTLVEVVFYLTNMP